MPVIQKEFHHHLKSGSPFNYFNTYYSVISPENYFINTKTGQEYKFELGIDFTVSVYKIVDNKKYQIILFLDCIDLLNPP